MSLLRNKLALIGLACAAPLVLGTAAYLLGWAPGAPANYGELIEPRPVGGALEPLRGKWVLVAFDAADCDAGCEKKLYYMRQVRRAQGRNMGRVERLWVLTGGGAPRERLLAAIEGTHVVRDRGLSARFPGDPAEHIYVVDPLGNLMMRFPGDPDASRMLKDIERLLRLSRIG